ncbi:MAG TPA: hypothetical protein VF585_09835 [Chthoniobacterales bacterium]|jgi:hypothetical protein
MKSITRIAFALVLAAAPALLQAADPTPPAAETEKAAVPRPFHGTVGTVYPDENYFDVPNTNTTTSRTFKVAPQSKITREGKEITIKDVNAGDEVRGMALKTGDRQYEVVSAKVGPKSEEEKAADQKRKEKKAAKESAESSAAE